ncbi:hypothetical protein PV327_005347 [Microctonus hyperodae]|uniref:Uncharacterized protein n=1 Tax=Microctonus hyperodae TaxID=165561 RepID=A0AA39G160_MICHY|nr:hypothetical protein PV327_005347 [Microctonus hyperodae]
MFRLLLLYLTINHRAQFIVSNEIVDEVKELKNAPPDHVIPFSEHEDPPEPPTKPKYFAPGEWAKPPLNKSRALEFIPTKLYTQVRQTHTQKRVPREEALRQAKTDEEKENAARLKEVVTKRKVNTVYTEEGYEDAAYDHGGHIRDADVKEKYSLNNPNTIPKKQMNKNNSDEIINDDSVVNDKFIIENEVEKLEKDLSREDKEAAKGAETEVPENLRDLTDDSGSYDYDDEEKSKESIRDYDYEDKENDRATTSTESYTSDSEEIPLTKESLKKPVTFKQSEEIFDHFHKTPAHDFSPVLKELSSMEDDSKSSDYGRVFWDYFKTTKSPPPLRTIDSQLSQHKISVPKIELQASASSKNPSDHTHMYPSLSQIYETWKQRGVEQSYTGASPEREITELNETTTIQTSGELSEDDSEESAERKPKKRYMIMVRDSKKYSNDSNNLKLSNKNKNSNSNFMNDSENIINPEEVKENITMTQTPDGPSLGQVTYADFLRNTYGNLNNPPVTQESGVLMEQIIPGTISYYSDASPGSLVGPAATPPIYRYRQHQQRHHQKQRPLTRQNRKRQILSLIKMLPPSRNSRSEYAQYNPQRRNGSVKSDHDPWPDVYKNYRSVFHLDGKTSNRRKRFSTMIDKGLDNVKVMLNGVKNIYQSVNKGKFNLLRKKRDVQELLIGAPRIVDELIDKEIKSRFPDDDDNDDEIDVDAEEEKNYSGNYGKKERDKVEVELPEFNFSDVTETQDNNEENESVEAPPIKSLDNEKYPFYHNDQISHASPLKYVISPRQVPQKTHGGSEFYESRDKYMSCEDIEPDVSKELPEDDHEPVPDGDLKKNLPRLRGLGDKLSCLRDKYFDKNPLDNPLFKEKRIESPEMPEELNPVALKLAFSSLIGDPEANFARRISRKPEIIDLRSSNSQKNHITNEFENKSNNGPEVWNNHAKKYRRRYSTTTATPDALYQRQVYEDVMGTIKNMAHMYQPRPVTSKPLATPNRISKSNSNINYSSESSRDRDKNQKNNHIIVRPIPSPSPILTIPQVASRYKFMPYRTNRVSYKTRPRIDSIPGSNIPRIVGYFKTVRVHKRSVDTLGPNTSNKANERNILVRNSTRLKRIRRPKSTSMPETSSQASDKIIYTIDDRVRHSKPRGRARYGQFTTSSTILNEETRRSEPRYTPIRKFDDDVHKLEYLDKNGETTDDIRKTDGYGEVVERDQVASNENGRRYDVHEEEQEKTTQTPIILENDNSSETQHTTQYSEDGEGSGGDSEEFSNKPYRGEESRGNEKEEETDDKESENKTHEEEQVERPSGSYKKNSGEGSHEAVNDEDESSHETHSYDDAEKNLSYKSEGEEEFERFQSRPFSPFNSNEDEKYSDLGPRVSKPEFYHPPFDSIKSKKSSVHREDNEDEHRYTFPWHYDDEDASEESKRYERFSGQHEYPWERRERLARQRGRSLKDGDGDDEASKEEQGKSGTITRFRKLYPWEIYNVPSMGYGINRASNYFSPMYEFDNYGFSSQFRPIKFSSRYQSKLNSPKKYVERENKKKFRINYDDDNNNNVISTTVTSQIPATSATLPSLIGETTTQSMKINASVPVYTVRPRSRRLGNPKTTVQTVTLRTRIPRRRGQSLGISSDNKKSENARKQSLMTRRRSRMTTLTTIKPPLLGRKRFSKNVGGKSTTPRTNRNVEHRSKVSKEEIITKMTFPDSEQTVSDYEISSPKNEMMKKVSIITKETPEHIYRTEEVNKNGVKDTFFTILPNNNTQTSLEYDKNMSIDRIGIEEPVHNENITKDSPGFDVSLPIIPANAMQLNEHGTRKVMSSISWIAENYDY